MKHGFARKLLSLLLALCMLLSTAVTVSAAGTTAGSGRRALSFEKVDGVEIDAYGELPEVEKPEQAYADTDQVRVSIVLKDRPTLAVYSAEHVAQSSSAMAYRRQLRSEQAQVTAQIERQVLNGRTLDVVWNMTLAANLISANVLYGQIAAIEALPDVEQVVIETAYEPLKSGESAAEPLMSSSSGMIGAGTAWAAGYTGAGSRIAIIDTGLDTDHQSFDNGAYLYSLGQLAADKGMTAEEYIRSLDLLGKAEIESVLQQLNIYSYVQYLAGTKNGAYYLSEKVPFALNYVDRNYEVTHDNDSQGEHGSHVAGIAAANRFIPDSTQESGYANALESVRTQGVAPDAQLIIMKVYGVSGGAYESDYMSAVEDAILLGCDVVNLSLGGGKGFARSQLYQDILDSLEQSDTIVTIAAGNDGAWPEHSADGVGYLHADDVDLATVASPAAAVNSLAVASADNTGLTDYYISVGGRIIFYNRGVLDGQYTAGLNVLGGGDYAYAFLDGIGTAEEVQEAAEAARAAGLDLGKTILVCSRGTISFAEKASNADAAGFAACIIYNNADGVMSIGLQGYEGSAPCAAISKADAAVLREAAGGDGVLLGTLYVSDKVTVVTGDGKAAMSSFSSWGVPGSLELKPEITAPGGNIYSVDGSKPGGTAYENMSGTSMASPQTAGMAAVLMQYIRENGLDKKTGRTARQLATSLLMATAEPLTDAASGTYYSVLQQGAGLANLAKAMQAGSYIRMDDAAASGAADGKVKAELGDDPDRSGSYQFSFTIHNFSNSARRYRLSSDFFTQALLEAEGGRYLSTAAADLAADVTYTVNSRRLTASSAYDCDLDGDGLTDGADAQIILDYAAGNRDAIAPEADLSGDGAVNSYDAYLLLASLSSDYFQVDPGAAVTVQVSVTLADKAALDAEYVSGAYVEGYVYVEPAYDAEGNAEPTSSIPVLGFYGNWSDASMYDRADYEDAVYGEAVSAYTGYTNYLTIWPGGTLKERYFTGNPYLTDETYPAGKEAIRSDTQFGDFVVTLIRAAGSAMLYVTDGDGNFVVADGMQQGHATYYSEARGSWLYARGMGAQNIWTTPEDWGFEEGDELTIGLMAVPEYYETDGALTLEDMKALMKSGSIGEGAYHAYTFTVDDTAPEVLSVVKNADGDLTVEARDGRYIAMVAVLDGLGSTILTKSAVEQEAAGAKVSAVIDMDGLDEKINRDCMIMVADYAGNESFYKVSGYNDGYSFAGHMYGFTNTATRGTVNSWLEIDPTGLYAETDATGETTYYGTKDMAHMPWSVTAAEYVNGYVFMVTAEGCLYAAPHGDWENAALVGRSDRYSSIRDLAYSTKDKTLYALCADNSVCAVDLATGALTERFHVGIAAPDGAGADGKVKTFTADNRQLLAMTIDDDGRFYAVNNGKNDPAKVYLYSWTADDAENGEIGDLAPVNRAYDGNAGESVYNSDGVIGGMSGSTGKGCVQSMAWDHDNGVLYWAAAMSSVSPFNIVYTFDTATGKAAPATEGAGGIFCNVSGLYIVPERAEELEGAANVTAFELAQSELTLFENARYALTYTLFPWNLADKSLVWTSGDESVAAVDADGVVTARAEGTAVITGETVSTTAGGEHLKVSCTVTVKKVQDVTLRGLLYTGAAEPQWVEFSLTDPQSRSVLPGGGQAGHSFLGGTLLNNTLFVHDGSHMYAVDANTFEVTDFGALDESWLWSDAAPAPRNREGFFGRIVGVISGGKSFGVMDVTTGIASELSHYDTYRYDPAALIAYKGETDLDGHAAYEYYVLTESGALYLMTTYGYYDADANSNMYTDVTVKLGDTGLDLTGAADTASGRHGTMYYDGTNGALIVAYSDGETGTLYAVDPENCSFAQVSAFERGVQPLLALYQYRSFDRLTVLVQPEQAELYAGETVKLSAKVYQYESSAAVRWSSSDESIATVDADGVVTARRAGTVTITAASVEGEASAEAVITVKPLAALNLKLHAYLSTEGGNAWALIDGENLRYELLSGKSGQTYTGAAVSEGKIYATDESFYYEIDPADGYAAVRGDNFTDGDGASFLYMRDGTSVPRSQQTLNGTSVTVGGKPVYLSGYDGVSAYYLTVLEEFLTGEYGAATLESGNCPAAVAYHYSKVSDGSWYDYFYVLCYNGVLRHYYLAGEAVDGEIQYYDGGWVADGVNTGLVFDSTDGASAVYVDTADFTGLVIAHTAQSGVELYCFDTAHNTMEKMGVLSDVSGLVGLSLLSDVAEQETKTVTFRVVNGTWADGSTADIVKTVELDEDGVGTVEVPTGMKAAEGYGSGAWDVTPTGFVDGPDPVTYTYTFEKSAQPAGGGKLIAWVFGESGMSWSEIDPAAQTVTTVKADGTAYTGAGVLNGKIYAGAAGSYYEIDPADGYSAAKGAALAVTAQGYSLTDGAGAPAKTVTLNGTSVAVGGYFLHAFAGEFGSELYLLRDYTAGCAWNDTTVDTDYSIYGLNIVGVAYLSGSVSADGTAYYEDFLFLCADGTLYRYRLTTDGSGLKDQGEMTLVEKQASLVSAYGASMACVDGNTVMIAVNKEDCTVLYRYDLANRTLTTAYTMFSVYELHGLAFLSEVSGQESAGQKTGSAVRAGKGGSLMSTAAGSSGVDVERSVTLRFAQDTDVTNGVFEVSFDPAVLRYAGCSSLNALYAVNSSQAEDGRLTVAYAAAGPITAGDVIAALRFDVRETGTTELKITVTGRGQESGLSEVQTCTVRVPGSTTIEPKPVLPGVEDPDHGEICPSLPFSDLSVDAWYHEYVDYVLTKGLMKGIGGDRFAPEAALSRSMLVQILYRLAGEPAVQGESAYLDVPSGRWYSDAIAWATENGIVNGYSKSTFGPDDPVTREQMATMLWRFAKFSGLNTGASADLSGYTDAGDVSSFAREAMQWACGAGIIKGVSGSLVPAGNAARVQAAAMLQRFCENVMK